MNKFAQRGAGMINHYDGPFLQRGSGFQRGNGFGSFIKGVVNFFRPLGKILKPLVSSPFVRDVGKDLISSGLDTVTETIRGKKFKDAAKQNLRVAKKRVLKTIHNHTRTSTGSDSEEETQKGGGTSGKKMKLATAFPPQTGVKKRRKGRRKKAGGSKKKKTSKKRTTFKKTKSRKKKGRKKVMKFKNTVFG